MNTKRTGRRSYGIYLNKKMAADVEEIAAELTDGNVHAVLQFAVKHFIKQYRAGKIKIQTQTVKKLKVD